MPANGEIECPYCGNNSECEKCNGRGDLKAYDQDNNPIPLTTPGELWDYIMKQVEP